ncbi:glycine cleavage system protein GcvH [uncultured Cohaesibacter sp.]|uniref:glycine cleavage system protein GcvH n=1 Tax=uncultured Cohaesibacter sp. TaxID=1002546 RepID=UPI0029C7F0FB|nr:glycine cleavage system protein GcvH [uncultured Cohaesibacter sp.]
MTTYYSEDHEWVEVNGKIATIGITDFAQKQLGDVVFVELPEVGRELEKGEEAAVVESVKAASEVYSPIDGEVTEVNETLEDEPALVNSDAESDAWFFKIKITDKSQLDDLMSEADYKDFVAEQE